MAELAQVSQRKVNGKFIKFLVCNEKLIQIERDIFDDTCNEEEGPLKQSIQKLYKLNNLFTRW